MAHAPLDPQTQIFEQDPAMVTEMQEHNPLRAHIQRTAAAFLITSGAVLLASGCGPSDASAEPQPAGTTLTTPEMTPSTIPTETTASPATTGNTTPTSLPRITPSSPGTTKGPEATQTPESTGHDTELIELAAASTPEKLAAMTPEQLKELFTIKPEHLKKGEEAESYIARVAVLYSAMLHAGFVPEAWRADMPTRTFTQNTLDSYISVAAKQLFNIDPSALRVEPRKPGDPAAMYPTDILPGTTYRYWFFHGIYVDGNIDKDYETSLKLLPDSVEAKYADYGVRTDFNVSGDVQFAETHDFTKRLDDMIAPQIDPETNINANAPIKWTATLRMTNVYYDKSTGSMVPRSVTLVTKP